MEQEQITSNTTEEKAEAKAEEKAAPAGRRALVTVLTGVFVVLFLMGLGALYVTFFTPYGQPEEPAPAIIDSIPDDEQLFYDAAKVEEDQAGLIGDQEAFEQQLLADVEAEMILSGKTLPFEITFEPARTCYTASAVSLYEEAG